MILTNCCCWVGYDTTNISCCRSWYFNWMSGGNIMHFTAMYYVQTHLYHLIRQPYCLLCLYVVVMKGKCYLILLMLLIYSLVSTLQSHAFHEKNIKYASTILHSRYFISVYALKDIFKLVHRFI